MKALVVAPQPFFSPRGTPFSVYYRALVMAQEGVEIDLVTYGEGDDVDIPGVTIHRAPRFKFLGNVRTGPSVLKIWLDIFVFFKTLALLMRNRYDFVHAHEEAVFFCQFLMRLFNFKLVYDMHSSLPEQLTNFKFTGFKPVIRLFKYLEDRALSRSHAVITICPALADYVEGIIGKDGLYKHILIENSIFDPVKLSTKQNDSGSSPKMVDPGAPDIRFPKDAELIYYAGTLEPYQGIDIVIDGFSRMADQRPQAYLLVIGGSPGQVEQYSCQAQKLGIDHRVYFTGRVPQARATEYMQHARVLLSPRIDGINTPLKIYQQLASGIPLVATRIHSHTQVLDDEVAFLVEPDPESMGKGMLDALENREEAMRRARNAKTLYEERYSRPVYEKKIRHLLQRLESCAASSA